MAELAGALRPFSFDAFDPARLLADLERFEDTSQPSDARHVADDYLQSVTLWGTSGELAERLETNYRNANIRLALSEKLLKRLLPETSTTTDAVRDEFLGLPTRGTSVTSTAVDVKFVPDDRRLRVALEASGQILANTRSTSGPATLFTNSDSIFYARKVIDLDLHGIRTWPAESECIDSRTRLRSVSTDFDGVPLVGALVETVARSRHAEQEDEVRRLLRRKVEAQARRKMDTIAQERFDKVNRLLQERVVEPLVRLTLDPQVISAETSEQRLTVRLRLAGEEQLAGHTPRPRAPGDSLLSLQIHQSMFNNVCEQLKLDGRAWRMPELRKHIIEALNLKDSRFMDETDKEVSITFADENAVRVRCENGRIELSLAVARLTNDVRTWKNFVVRVLLRATSRRVASSAGEMTVGCAVIRAESRVFCSAVMANMAFVLSISNAYRSSDCGTRYHNSAVRQLSLLAGSPRVASGPSLPCDGYQYSWITCSVRVARDTPRISQSRECRLSVPWSNCGEYRAS